MNRAELLALAERVEKEEPSAELDSDIVHAIGQPWTHPYMVIEPEIGPVRAPRFCTSLDAAASLVPQTARWAIGPDFTRVHRTRATVWVEGHTRGRVVDGVRDDDKLAAALTAAALRAIAMELPND
jgi:hypothetical protein